MHGVQHMTQAGDQLTTSRLDEPDAYERALAVGRDAFGQDWEPTRVVKAPGRLELLGNHIDYNGGPVLAAAIDRFVVVAVDEQLQDANDIAVVMADAEDRQVVRHAPWILADWRNLQPPPGSHDYVRGAIATTLARDADQLRGGTRVAVAGDVPIGFGLSSSAALCVALTLALNRNQVEDRDLVLRAQEAEHRAGTPCGTMDQSASVGGGIIRYDGATSTFERLDPDLGDLVFAVANSGVHRSLGESSYPIRVSQSAEALAIVNQSLGIDLPNLAALTIDQLHELERLDPSPLSPVLMRRVRHVVTETVRVREGIDVVNRGEWTRFGELMTESGRSSALDYEISHPKVEELVAESLDVEGVLGARMMGGGEGGTALILLPMDVVPTLRSRLSAGYYRRNPVGSADTAVYVFGFAPGAG
jgi:galactokinase